MAKLLKTEIEIKNKFNSNTKRRSMNGIPTVLHCHHFITLYTQLAMDARETELLEDVAEESFYEVLNKYFKDNKLTDFEEKVEIACQYYYVMGLGSLEVAFLGEDSTKIVSKKSHIEEGWIEKWGENSKAVNFIGCGYISAMLSSVFDKPFGIYKTTEYESLVKGDKETIFKTLKK